MCINSSLSRRGNAIKLQTTGLNTCSFSDFIILNNRPNPSGQETDAIPQKLTLNNTKLFTIFALTKFETGHDSRYSFIP